MINPEIPSATRVELNDPSREMRCKRLTCHLGAVTSTLHLLLRIYKANTAAKLFYQFDKKLQIKYFLKCSPLFHLTYTTGRKKTEFLEVFIPTKTFEMSTELNCKTTVSMKSCYATKLCSCPCDEPFQEYASRCPEGL